MSNFPADLNRLRQQVSILKAELDVALNSKGEDGQKPSSSHFIERLKEAECALDALMTKQEQMNLWNNELERHLADIARITLA